MEEAYLRGIKESRRVRIERSLAHVEAMRDAYVAIVRERMDDQAISQKRKRSHYAIAKLLTDSGFRSPREKGDITYSIVRRLSELVGDILPLPKVIPEKKLQKPTSELVVGDCVMIISKNRPSRGKFGIIRVVATDLGGFGIQINPNKPKLTFFLEWEVRHQLDERLFYDPLSMAEMNYDDFLRLQNDLK